MNLSNLEKDFENGANIEIEQPFETTNMQYTATEVIQPQQELPPKNDLMVLVQNSGVEKSDAQTILANFTVFFENANRFESQINSLVINDVSQVAEMKLAGEYRKILKRERLNAKSKYEELQLSIKQQMAVYVNKEKLLKNIFNIVETLYKSSEVTLDEKEKFAINKEKERKERVKNNRIEILSKYPEINVGDYNLTDMSDVSFDRLVEMCETNYQEQLRKEKERIDEENRIKEQERLDRLRIEEENRKLKEQIELDEQRKLEAIKAQRELEIKRFPARKQRMIDLGFTYYENAEYNFTSPFWSCFQEQIEQPNDDDFNSYMLSVKQAKVNYEIRIAAEKKAEIERKKQQDLLLKQQAEAKAKEEQQKQLIAKRNNDLKPYISLIRDYNKVLNMAENEYEQHLKELNLLAIKEAKIQAEQQEKARIAAEKQAKEQQKLKEKADAEKALRLKLEKAINDKKEAEIKVEKERIATEKAALKAPDKAKFEKLITDLKSIQIPEMKSDEAKKIITEFTTSYQKYINWLNIRKEEF